VTLENGKGQHSKFLPFAFTEQGIAMLSSVLSSKKAVQMNIQIIRAFVLIRQSNIQNNYINLKLKQLETHYNKQFDDVFEAINYLMKKDTLAKQQIERKKIGFNTND